MLTKKLAGIPSGTPVLIVSDTLKALQGLAAYNRSKNRVPVIGVTGSNGKTTTKDMIASVLGVKYRVLKSKGSYNNEIGLPLTLLNMDESHDVVVLEMGMRGPGEIDSLCRIAGITGAVITTIGETHLELLGSVGNVAAAKGEILEHVPRDGFAVLNADSPFMEREAARNKGRTMYFGITKGHDLGIGAWEPLGRGSYFVLKTEKGHVGINLPLPGKHNVSNALAAAGVGICMGLSLSEIKEGLEAPDISPMRLQFLDLVDITVINDTYNASPASVKAALDALGATAQAQNRTVAVLGDMFELGDREKSGHLEVGRYVAGKGVDLLFALGDLAKHIAEGATEAGMPSRRVFWFGDKEKMFEAMKEKITVGDIILVKGSRGMHMEDVVEYLTRCF